MSCKLIFGGAFNPVHNGHLRAAIEVSARLGFDCVEWVPSYAPLHKADHALLPFGIRVALLSAAFDGDAAFAVNAIEASLPTPSVTVQTLEAMTGAEPAIDRHFMLGDREFLKLHQWLAGARVAELANIVVVCRTEFDLDDFAAQVARAWPNSRRVPALPNTVMAFELVPGRRVVVVAIPRIDVSSSLVRRLWLEGRDVSHLVPAPVLEMLEAHRAAANAAWTSATHGPAGIMT